MNYLSASGVWVVGIATIVFIMLKAAGVVTWSWLLVLAPIWIVWLLFLAALVVIWYTDDGVH